MALITKPKTFVDNEKLLYTDLNSLMDTIYNEFNGSISNTNIASDAAIATTKISGTAATLNGVETLTNKTLTSPTITGATVTTSTITSPTLTTPTLTLANSTTMTTDGGIVFDRTNEKLLVGDGTNTRSIKMGAWTAFTPTVSGAVSSIGNATIACAYTQLGKLVVARYSIIFGSSTSFTAGTMTITFPVNSLTYGYLGNLYIQAGGTGWFGSAITLSSTTFNPAVAGTSATYSSHVGTTNLIPATFAATDQISGVITYEAV